MPISKLSIAAPSLDVARAVSEALENINSPADSVSLFEERTTGGWRIDALYAEEPDQSALDAMLRLLNPALPPSTWEILPDENWVAVSQAALPPVNAGRFVVHGSHDRAFVGQRQNAIEIDAGEAFGTAHHATTQGCLIALDAIAHERTFRNILDLGCGSGVLAIAAAKLFPKARITASDIDALAVSVARGNARINRSSRRIRLVAAQGLRHADLRGSGRFDLVFANILAGPLIRLGPDLRNAISTRGGIVILSGLLAEQAREVRAAYLARGFHLRYKYVLHGWATLVLERIPRAPITTDARRAA